MSKASDDTLLQTLEAVVARAWSEGCPIAGPQSQEILARAALRRWRSFTRRHGLEGSLESRVEDLAKGLEDSIEPDRAMVGRLMADYRWLAEQLTNELRHQSTP